MIDLHMHTTTSDGELTVQELLDKCVSEKIECFSITDHNHALAYELFDVGAYPQCIVGAEIATSYEGTVIELLLYKGDYKVINKWYRDFYSDQNLEKIETFLFEELIQISKKAGYRVSTNLELEHIEKGISKKTVYYDLVKNNDNFKYDTYRSFFRQGLSNPKSDFFLDEGRTYPSIDEVVELAQKAGARTILAHPYEYGIDIEILKELVLDKFDGLETYHPSCAVVNSVALVEFCVNNKILGSMGSDFHKLSRKIPLGVHIPKEISEQPCFDWIKED